MARSALQLPFVGLGVALLEIDFATVEAEQAHHAVAVEELIVLETGRELRVGMDTVKGSMKLLGHVALHFQVEDVALDPERPQCSGEAWCVGIMRHLPSSDYSRCDKAQAAAHV